VSVLLEREDGIAILTLDRPDAANAIDLALAQALSEHASSLAGDPTVRVVLLKGNGRIFCGGGDLRSFAPQPDIPRHLRELTMHLHTAIARLARMDAPVIAAVHGSAAGAGFSLACACDIVVAAESARFVLAYSKVGLTPDGSASWFLPRLIGLRRALDLALTNRVLSAQEALEWGLVTRVVPDADLDKHALELAREIAHAAPRALAGAKRLMRGSFDATLETQMELETDLIAGAAATADAREGIAAFLEKRPPRFGGTG
jgi:2-(1,2-epoxy-1,2-dihydrophenyl)acetyl-CoA isomerase